MSLPPAEYIFVADSIHITGLDDPVVDLLGHDPRSAYVERFWLSILGPSTTFLLRHLAARLDADPDGFDLDLTETANMLGLRTTRTQVTPFIRALARTGQFHLTEPCGPTALAVRRRLPSLTRQQVRRLSPALRDQHDTWQDVAHREPTIEQRRTRARRLALSLLELGETEEATEHQLHRWKVHPALAHEALRWAHTRRGEVPAPPTPTGDQIVAAASGARPGGPVDLRSVRPRPSGTTTGVAHFDPFDHAEEPDDAA